MILFDNTINTNSLYDVSLAQRVTDTGRENIRRMLQESSLFFSKNTDNVWNVKPSKEFLMFLDEEVKQK